jgi:transcriptional regulator with XRE-family HTH domain
MQELILVYADGHICANNPAYVRKNKQGIYRLTDLAIKSVDTCCLLFRIDYYILEEVGYKVGVLSCDDRQIKYKSELADVFGCETGLIGLTMKPCEENRALPFRFGDTLRYYREAAHMTQKKLAEDLDVEERTILRIENNQTTKISLRMVLLIAFEFKMKPPNVRDLLGKARFVADETPVGQALNLIIGMFNQFNKEMLETVADEYEAILASSTEEEAITFSLAKKQRSHMRAG